MFDQAMARIPEKGTGHTGAPGDGVNSGQDGQRWATRSFPSVALSPKQPEIPARAQAEDVPHHTNDLLVMPLDVTSPPSIAAPLQESHATRQPPPSLIARDELNGPQILRLVRW